MKIMTRTFKLLSPILFYLLISVVYWGIQIWPDLTTQFIGAKHGDGFGHIWLLGIWQVIFSQHGHLFITKQVWSPIGFNLAHTSNLVGLGIINHWFGWDNYSPVFIYNFWMLAAPILAALSAFLLCYTISKKYLASLIGGFIYGYSPYMLGHVMGGHLELLLIFPAPVLALLLLLHAQEKINSGLFVILTTFFSTLYFSFSPELLIAYTIVTAALWILIYCIHPSLRKALQRTAIMFVFANILTLLCVSDYLYFFIHDYTTQFAKNITDNANPFLGFLIPTPLFLIGGHLFKSIANQFPADLYDSTGYICLPLLYILFDTCRNTKKHPYYFPILFAVIVSFLLSMGPRFHFLNAATFPFLWWPFSHIPILDFIMPGRLSYLAYLFLALLLCIWLACRSFKIQLLFLLLIIAFYFPAKDIQFQNKIYHWITPINPPAFLKNDTYKKYITKDDTVFFIPMSEETGAFQAITHNYFRLTAHPTDSLPIALSSKQFESLFSVMSACHSLSEEKLKQVQPALTQFIHKMQPDKIIILRTWNLSLVKNNLAKLNYTPIYQHDYIIYERKK